MTDRTKAMDELIAGDADLYNVRAATLQAAADVVLHSLACSICLEINHCKCDTSKSWSAGPCQPPTDKLAEAILELGNHPIAYARIKGDKDRENPVERPHEPAYNHTQDGTANFERALSYASSIEAHADLQNSAYVAFMAERGDHLNMLVELAHQYLSDLRYPPAPDGKERRIERINEVLAKLETK